MEFGRNAFNEVLERVESMPLEEQALIIEILENRYAEKRREGILRNAEGNLEEYRKGLTSKGTVAGLMKDEEEKLRINDSARTISCTKLSKKLGTLLEETHESEKPIFVTKRGKISGVLLSVEAYEALVNTFDFPWLFQLQPKHRREFLSELRKSWQAAIEQGEWEQLRQTIEDWQATAEVDAEPEVAYYLKLAREKKEYKAWEEIRATVCSKTVK